MNFGSDFFQSKTTWTALLVILTAACAYIEGNLDGKVTVGGIFLAMLVAFVRDTLQKNTDAVNSLVMVEPTDLTDTDTEEPAP